MAFAQAPADSRSACVAVLAASSGPRAAVEACRAIGAPIVFVCFQDTLQWWKQGTSAAELLETVPAGNVERFFESHIDSFSPEAVYRAKTWGRFQASYQLSFVDIGLMPLVEEEVGRSLGALIERTVSTLKKRLGWTQITDEQGHWLLQSVFWLVSARILKDKRVPHFEALSLTDVDEVFRRVGNHYGTTPLEIGSQKNAEALLESAQAIERFSNLVLTTTEALAYVYENTLISENTRSALGTHSTPSFLVDYVVGNLAEWIEEIPVNERSVFEPACGHGAFLVSAMRLLTELLPTEQRAPSRRGSYLRSRLHGTDVDRFALELARLSLTLTDIPNPDGWDLKVKDMFRDNSLATQAKQNTILLANPPFDNFSPEEQPKYNDQSSQTRFVNKATEMLWRTVPQMPDGSVFGVVLPQTILHSGNARELREFLIRDCELQDICLFPDKVFSFSDAESAVILGRRRKTKGMNKVRYHRVRERELDRFRSAFSAASTRSVPQSRFSSTALHSFTLPDLEEVWVACDTNPELADVATVGQGLEYRGKDLSDGSTTYSEQRFVGSHPGFVHFERGLELHELPTPLWMNLARDVIRRPLSGSTFGTPQVLVNYARVSRGPWRLKALIDKTGHPFTSRFISVRPKGSAHSLETLWAILNSPLANAYAYSHLGKRDNIVGDIRKIPMPKGDSLRGLDRAARTYLAAASSTGESAAQLNALLRLVDAEVLKLYSLPLDLERRLLGLFNDWERVGVPFSQTRYLPAPLEGKVGFPEFLRFEESWSLTNRQRVELIDKNIAGDISEDERARLEVLQAYADYHIQEVAPRPTNLLDDLEKRLFGAPEEGRDR